MHYARVEEGEVFVMGQGEKGDLSYASGLYRATADLDLGVLHGEFMSDDRIASSDDEEVKLLFGDEDDYRRHRWERLFQEWLLRKGHVERMPCKILALCSDFRKKPDGSGPEGVIYSSLNEPFAEGADMGGPFPRW